MVFLGFSFFQVPPPKLARVYFLSTRVSCPAYFMFLDSITRILLGEE